MCVVCVCIEPEPSEITHSPSSLHAYRHDIVSQRPELFEEVREILAFVRTGDTFGVRPLVKVRLQACLGQVLLSCFGCEPRKTQQGRTASSARFWCLLYSYHVFHKGRDLVCSRGHLDYKEKVSRYWPEFAANGKQDVTVDMLLSCQVRIVPAEFTFRFWSGIFLSFDSFSPSTSKSKSVPAHS